MKEKRQPCIFEDKHNWDYYKISGDFKICDEILEQAEWVGR